MQVTKYNRKEVDKKSLKTKNLVQTFKNRGGTDLLPSSFPRSAREAFEL